MHPSLIHFLHLLSISLLSGIVVVLGAATFLSYYYDAETVVSLVAPRYAKRITYDSIRLYALVTDSDRARERYLAAAEMRNLSESHAVAHHVGQMLYEREGSARALSLCGTDYNYGCLHEVVGITMFDKGTNVVDSLLTACRESTGVGFGACAHGVGHGLVYVAKYDPAALFDALSMCDTIHSSHPRFSINQSCYVGVFMEYNMHFLEMNDGEPRKYNPTDPHSPCNELTDSFHRSLCVFWLVPWIHGDLYRFSYELDAFRGLGDFCRKITPLTDQRTCFSSIGRSIGLIPAIHAEYAFSLCKAAAKEDIQARNACAIDAAHGYHMEDNNADFHNLCAKLGMAENDCIAYRGMISLPKEKRKTPTTQETE